MDRKRLATGCLDAANVDKRLQELGIIVVFVPSVTLLKIAGATRPGKPPQLGGQHVRLRHGLGTRWSCTG